MTETRHKTVLEVSVKATDVEKASEGVKDLFDPDRLSDFARGVEQITRSFEFLQRNLETIDRMMTKIAAAQSVQSAQAGRAALPGGIEGAEASRFSYASIVGAGGAFGGGGASGGWRPGGAGEGGGNAERICCGDGSKNDATSKIKEEREKEAHKWYKRQNLERWSAGVGRMFSPTGMAQGIASAIPILGPALGGLLSGISGFAGSYAAQQQSVASAFGNTGVADGMMGVGQHFGLAPGEVPGALSEFGQRSGMRGKRLGGAFSTNLLLSRGLGISGAGSYVSAAETGGGHVSNPARLMMEAVSSGLSAGIRVARIDDYLQNISAWTDEARTKGINVSPDYGMSLIRQITASTKLKGEATTGFAKSQKEAFTGWMSGKPSLGQNLMMQSIQEVLGPGASLSEMMLEAENPSAEAFRVFNKKAQGYGKGHREGVYAISQVTGLGFAQSKALLEGDWDEKAGAPSQREVRNLLGQEGAARGAAFAVAQREAKHEGKVVATGSQVYDTAKRIEDLEMAVAGTMAPAAAGMLDKGLDFFKAAADGFMHPADTFKDAAEIFRWGVEKFIGAIEDDPVGRTLMHGELPLPDDATIEQRTEAGQKRMIGRGRWHTPGTGGKGPKTPKLLQGLKVPPADKHSSIGNLRDILHQSGELQKRAGDLIEQLGFADESEVRAG